MTRHVNSADQLCALNRDCCSDCHAYLSSAVLWSVTHKMSAVSYDLLTHSRHNAGDRSAKVYAFSLVCCEFSRRYQRYRLPEQT